MIPEGKLIGWGWMLWDWNWFRARTAGSIFARMAARVSPGDIIVMHDGDESAPRKDQRQTWTRPRGWFPRGVRKVQGTDPVQAFFLNRAHKTRRVRIAIRRLERRPQNAPSGS